MFLRACTEWAQGASQVGLRRPLRGVGCISAPWWGGGGGGGQRGACMPHAFSVLRVLFLLFNNDFFILPYATTRTMMMVMTAVAGGSGDISLIDSPRLTAFNFNNPCGTREGGKAEKKCRLIPERDMPTYIYTWHP